MEGEGLPGEAEVGSLGWPLGGGTTREEGGGRRRGYYWKAGRSVERQSVSLL